jgi:hypothetical protein
MFNCWLSVPANGAGQRGRILGGALGGVAGLLLLCASTSLLVWCLLRRRRRMHQTRESLAEGDERHTSEREAAVGLVLQTTQARHRELQVRVPRLERSVVRSVRLCHTRVLSLCSTLLANLCLCARSGSTHACLCVSGA